MNIHKAGLNARQTENINTVIVFVIRHFISEKVISCHKKYNRCYIVPDAESFVKKTNLEERDATTI
jgi:hypothetical protein